MVWAWTKAHGSHAFTCLDAQIVQEPPCHAAIQVAEVQGVCGRLILTVAHQRKTAPADPSLLLINIA